MKHQSLNVDIQPIMLDMNSIIQTHIATTVRKFNIQYITTEINEQKKKLNMLEEELNRLLNEDGNLTSKDTNVLDKQNIELIINDTKKVSSSENRNIKKVVKMSEPENEIVIDETKTNKVVEKNEKEVEEEEEEDGIFEIEIDGISYYTNDEMNGQLYTIDVNGDPEDVVGRLKDGEPIFN